MDSSAAAVLDANVLAESAVSDLLLRLAEGSGLIQPKWSETIWEETQRTLIFKLGWPPELADRRAAAAKDAFPEAWIEGFEHLIDQCGNDPRDRHILAAAVHSRTRKIVTMNVRHFRDEHLTPWGVFAHHPSVVLEELYRAEPSLVLSTLQVMAEKRGKSLGELLSRLSASVPGFTLVVASDLQIVVERFVAQSSKRRPPN